MEEKPVILYVEDDPALAFLTSDNLKLEGFNTDLCKSAEEALEKFKNQKYDLCILDIMLPGMDGFGLARKIREANTHIPILFITAKSTHEDKIRGLKIGGDDYITKPFSIEELILKIKIFLKRSQPDKQPAPCKKQIGLYTFDPDNQTLCISNESISLTYKESQLLLMLYGQRNSIVRRDEILLKIWENDSYFSGRSLDVFISRLRKYLKKDDTIVLENIHGIGFRLKITN
jgi:two-component system, OmpR family, response regulator VicR